MILELTSTIIGKEIDGWWIFSGIMAERVCEVTGLKIVKSFGGEIKTGFPVKDECIYTPMLVKNGFKLCIKQ